MCLALPFLLRSLARDQQQYPPQPTYTYDKPPPGSSRAPSPRPPPPLPGSGVPPQYSAPMPYDPWQGPPGYISPEAGRWKGPLSRRKYEGDVQRYGIVDADYRAKRRRRRGGAAAAAGAGAGC